jgi:hypothetical protein
MVGLQDAMMTDENEDKSRIYIEFEDIGSVEVKLYTVDNVTPMQLLALAHFFEFEGKNSLAVQRAAQMQAEVQRQQRDQIIVPKPKMEL